MDSFQTVSVGNSFTCQKHPTELNLPSRDFGRGLIEDISLYRRHSLGLSASSPHTSPESRFPAIDELWNHSFESSWFEIVSYWSPYDLLGLISGFHKMPQSIAFYDSLWTLL